MPVRRPERGPRAEAAAHRVCGVEAAEVRPRRPAVAEPAWRPEAPKSAWGALRRPEAVRRRVARLAPRWRLLRRPLELLPAGLELLGSRLELLGLPTSEVARSKGGWTICVMRWLGVEREFFEVSR